MRYVLSVALMLSWGLWFGGQATLVILVVTLFRKDRPTAVRAGPHLFHVFERYQFVLGMIAILCAVGLLIVSRRKRLGAIAGCFLLAWVGGIVSMTTTTKQMERLWREDRSESAEFASLHKKSQALYNTQFLLLLIAGGLMPGAIGAALRERERAPALETAPPA